MTLITPILLALLILRCVSIPPPAQQCDCEAYEPLHIQKRIVKGQAADKHEYPYQTFILIPQPKKSYYFGLCGGTLISNKWIVSAAHCFVWIINNESILPRAEALRIRLAEHDYIDVNETIFTKNVFATELIIHEQYDWVSFNNDISLIKLEKQITFSNYINPICLPFGYEDLNFIDRTITVIGWGSTGYENLISRVLMEAEMTIRDNFVCEEYYTTLYKETMMCAKNSKGSDACQGDSGGPGIWINEDNHNFLIGVVSYGDRCGSAPGVFVKVTSYLQWIQIQTNELFCTPRRSDSYSWFYEIFPHTP